MCSLTLDVQGVFSSICSKRTALKLQYNPLFPWLMQNTLFIYPAWNSLMYWPFPVQALSSVCNTNLLKTLWEKQGFPCKFLFLCQQIRQLLKIGASRSQQREPVTVIVHMPPYAHSPTTFFKVLSWSDIQIILLQKKRAVIVNLLTYQNFWNFEEKKKVLMFL